MAWSGKIKGNENSIKTKGKDSRDVQHLLSIKSATSVQATNSGSPLCIIRSSNSHNADFLMADLLLRRKENGGY